MLINATNTGITIKWNRPCNVPRPVKAVQINQRGIQI